MNDKDKAQLVTEWQANQLKFFTDHWPDIFLWDKLVEIVQALEHNRRVAVPSGHGVGKTWLLARIVLAFLFSHYPAKVITTAPTWTQVEKLLWAEIAEAYNSSVIDLGGELLLTSLKIDDNWFAIGFSTTGKAGEREFGAPKFQGFHSPNLLVALDEAPGVEHAIWVAAETLIAGENNRLIAIGNPTSPSGDFYEACKSPLWKKIEVSSFDHPNVKENRMIVPGAVTKEWIEERRSEWGEDSPLWIAKILGQFPAEGSDTLIPLSWAEACVGLGLSSKGKKKLGVDVARYGGDMTVLAGKFGKVIRIIAAVNKKDTNWTSGRIISHHREEGFDAIAVDDTGVGGGVTDAVEDAGYDVDAMNFGAQPIDDRFENLKAEIYWNLREDIKTKSIELPDDKELISQLCSIKYKFTRKGKIAIESKEELTKRGLKSPDKADAVAIVNSAGRTESLPEISIISVGGEDDE